MNIIYEQDRNFIISASLIWVSSLIVTGYSFIINKESKFSLDFVTIFVLIMLFIGILIRIKSRRILKRYFRIKLQIIENQKLVKTGIYAWIRHPAYLGSLLLSLAIRFKRLIKIIIFSSLFGFLIMLFIIPPFLYRIQFEEILLSQKFGSEYDEYKKHTPNKLLPFLF